MVELTLKNEKPKGTGSGSSADISLIYPYVVHSFGSRSIIDLALISTAMLSRWPLTFVIRAAMEQVLNVQNISSTLLSEHDPHTGTYLGADKNCNKAFRVSTDNHVQVACQDDNVSGPSPECAFVG